MSTWRDDPELVRQSDEDLMQHVDVSPDWEQLFEVIDRMVIGNGGGWFAGTQRAVLKGIMWQGRKRVAAEPEEARAFVVEALQMFAAALRIEPRELFPDLAAEPARVG